MDNNQNNIQAPQYPTVKEIPAQQQYAAPQYAAPQYVNTQSVPVQVQYVNAQGVPVQPQYVNAQGVPVQVQYVNAQGVPVQVQYVNAQGVPVQPQYVNAQGVPVQVQYAVQQPRELTEKEQKKRLRSEVRTDMGRHCGVLLLGQLISSGAMIALVIIFGIIIGVSAVASGTDFGSFDFNALLDTTSFPGMLATALATLIGNTLIYIPFAKKRGVRPFATFPGGEKPSAKFILSAAAIGLGLNYLWGIVFMGLCQLFPQIGNSTFGMDISTYSIPALITYIVLVCVIAPITEEFMMRGVLLHSLRRYGDRFAIVVTAILFGLLHGNIAQTPMAFLLGIVLGYVVVKTGSIKYSILIHFINNFIATAGTIASMYLPEYDSVITIIDLAFGISMIILSAVILIVNRKRLDMPKDSAEIKDGPIRCRYFQFFTTLWAIVFIVYIISVICISMMPTTELTSNMMTEYSEEMSGVISNFIR